MWIIIFSDLKFQNMQLWNFHFSSFQKLEILRNQM